MCKRLIDASHHVQAVQPDPRTSRCSRRGGWLSTPIKFTFCPKCVGKNTVKTSRSATISTSAYQGDDQGHEAAPGRLRGGEAKDAHERASGWDCVSMTTRRRNSRLINQDIEIWRKYGPLGMLHNIIVYLQASPIRMQNFLRLSRGRRPARDNKTRWNSWERMLKIALSPPVCDAILAYFRYYRDDEIALDELSAKQWETLKKIYIFLDDVAQMNLLLTTCSLLWIISLTVLRQ
jgi:hypothetical protein